MKQSQLPVEDKYGHALEVENGTIESVSISISDHGCLTAWLHIKFASGGCGFGGFMLGKASGGNIDGGGYAAEFIVRCLNTVGVEEWEKIAGRPVRCLHEGLGGGIVAIGHFMKDEWFCPRVEFKKDSK